MHRDYLISVSVAAGVHAVLLFGVPGHPGGPSPARHPEEKSVMWTPAPPPEPPDEPDVVIEPSEPRSLLPPPPRSPEPLTWPPPDVPTMTPAPPSIGSVDRTDLTSIVPSDVFTRRPAGPERPTVIGSEFLDATPRTRFQAEPAYPFEARRDGRWGEVYVEFTVDEQGCVHDARVVRSPDPVFDDATLRAVVRWRFEPGRRDGRVVAFRMVVPVVFSLRD